MSPLHRRSCSELVRLSIHASPTKQAGGHKSWLAHLQTKLYLCCNLASRSWSEPAPTLLLASQQTPDGRLIKGQHHLIVHYFSDQILCWCHALSFMHNKSSFSIYSSVKKLYRSYTVVELLRLPLSLCSYICSSLSLSYFHHILIALAPL